MSEYLSAGLAVAMAGMGIGVGVAIIIQANAQYGCKHEWEHIADVYPERGGNRPYARKYCCTKCCKKKEV